MTWVKKSTSTYSTTGKAHEEMAKYASHPTKAGNPASRGGRSCDAVDPLQCVLGDWTDDRGSYYEVYYETADSEYCTVTETRPNGFQQTIRDLIWFDDGRRPARVVWGQSYVLENPEALAEMKWWSLKKAGPHFCLHRVASTKAGPKARRDYSNTRTKIKAQAAEARAEEARLKTERLEHATLTLRNVLGEMKRGGQEPTVEQGAAALLQQVAASPPPAVTMEQLPMATSVPSYGWAPPAQLDMNLDWVVRTLKYYFSDENLKKDTYLKGLMMPGEGWFLIDFLQSFPRMQSLGADAIVLRLALAQCNVLEADATGYYARIRDPSRRSKYAPTP
mmetsp:Transcript_106928/g.300683  ORF Transcript_106928/g.300683 Transcript_106928/m.300683 type:complete len:334 (-) Transcript_106928:122-1123(-)